MGSAETRAQGSGLALRARYSLADAARFAGLGFRALPIANLALLRAGILSDFQPVELAGVYSEMEVGIVLA